MTDGTPIGMCGIVQRPYLDDPDIGFAFLPPFMGLGYAAESAQAILEQAVHVWKISKIMAFTTLDNQRSIALLQKIGLHALGPFFAPDSDEELLLLSNWGRTTTILYNIRLLRHANLIALSTFIAEFIVRNPRIINF